jgi:hypothetical protein
MPIERMSAAVLGAGANGAGTGSGARGGVGGGGGGVGGSVLFCRLGGDALSNLRSLFGALFTSE